MTYNGFSLKKGYLYVSKFGKINVKDFRTDEEIRKEEINTQIAEAKAYLSSTDFYMTVDKYAELDETRKVELTTKRAEAREFIKANSEGAK